MSEKAVVKVVELVSGELYKLYCPVCNRFFFTSRRPEETFICNHTDRVELDWRLKAIKYVAFQKYPKYVKDMVVEAVRQGMSYMDVSAVTGVCYDTVKDWCKARGVRSSACGGRYSHKFRERAVKLVCGGMTCRDVAKELRVSASTVYRWCKEAGVKPPGYKRQRKRRYLRKWTPKFKFERLYDGWPLALSPDMIADAARCIWKDKDAEEITKLACRMISLAVKRNPTFFAGRSRRVMVAGLLYIVGLMLGKPRTQIEIAEALGVSDLSIRNSCKRWRDLFGLDV